ncbi:hypothetical protein LXA47_18350 [Massilia sp. P8910]|uniref:hypothetical protein n=1 Tax=Massilia antarctica TaxID=2765360 RepID=UPI001E48883C|nr:hypothetical protein [Massilia antarctica]MCE3605549.1 hypothetical protein [Massilia antarctica]
MTEVGATFADALRPRWAAGLNTVKRPEFPSIESWLIKGTFGWLPAASGSARLDVRGSGIALTGALASEISRFSCAAYESLINDNPPGASTKALGWPLIRHYYATFYCAHALLRIAGDSLTYVSATTISTLNRVGGQYLGISPQLTAGLYQIKADRNSPNVIELTKISAGSGGSHEELWKQFLDFLIELENTIVLTQGQVPVAIDAVRVSTQLRTHLCRQGKGNGAWPSGIRNSLNYRHEHGVWYPYTKKAQSSADLAARLHRWKPGSQHSFEIGPTRDDLTCFADTCNVITQLLTASLSDIALRSPQRGKSFVDHFPFKLLRQQQFRV